MQNEIFRSSHRRCSVKKDVLKNFANFTGKHLCRSLFFNKVAGLKNFIKKRLQLRCFTVGFSPNMVGRKCGKLELGGRGREFQRVNLRTLRQTCLASRMRSNSFSLCIWNLQQYQHYKPPIFKNVLKVISLECLLCPISLFYQFLIYFDTRNFLKLG